MALAIRVENLGKCYRIQHAGSRPRYRYKTLRDSLTSGAAGLVRRWRHGAGKDWIEPFWALKDVSFDVQQGEVVGILGRNGAGKSTLLKIMSRITKPTTGEVRLHGRVGSLLEVATGFHPELSGRENIYLNGSILGMTRREITKRFDEIVAFSEVEQFLDTPVKRYSSGMYVRLAFAVAAHLELEILLIDEVLAVGDAQFQKKCLGKMEQIAANGRTIFFVSHQTSAVQRLCTQAIFLERGRLAAQGDKNDMIRRYLASGPEHASPECWIDLQNAERTGSGKSRFVAVAYDCPDDAYAHHPYPDGPLVIRVRIQALEARPAESLAATISDRSGAKLVHTDSLAKGEQVDLLPGSNECAIHLRSLHLNPGRYTLGLCLAHHTQVYDHLPNALQFDVVDSMTDKYGRRSPSDGPVTSQFDCFRTTDPQGAAQE